MTKTIERIGSEGPNRGAFRTFSDIPSSLLVDGMTVLLNPGTYELINVTGINNVAFIGDGDKEDVIVRGFTVANTVTGRVTFENIEVWGSNAAADSGTVCVEAMETDNNSELRFEHVAFANAELAVRHHGSGTANTRLDFCDATGVDQGVQCNATMEFSFCALNTSSNVYATSGGAAGNAPITVLASYSGGSNSGATTETIRALIS